MRVPYPERISYTWATGFAALLLVVQLLQHTDLTFALCCFCYILVATAAFNLAGGLYRPAGSYIFFNAVLTLIVGLIVKAVLEEPANSNLLAPTLTIEVYLMGMVGMLVAAYIENRFRPRRPLIARMFPVDSLRTIYLGAAITGVAFQVYLLTDPAINPGTVLSVLRNSNVLLPFAIIVGVIYNVQMSNGKRTMTPLLFGLIIVSTFLGFLAFSKQAMFTPVFCWILGAGIAHYKISPLKVIILGVMIFLLFYAGVPISQKGKDVQGTGGAFGTLSATIDMLMHLQATRAEVHAGSVSSYGRVNYFNQPEGIFDRLQMFSFDDRLVAEATRDGFYGYKPFVEGWENVIPHFLWKDKPVPFIGNVYGKQIGLLSPENDATSVSFSVSADAYKEGGFFSVLIMEPFCLICVFLALSFAAGDLRDHPAVILLVLITAHLAPEGAIPGLIQMIVYLFVVLEFALFCRYIFPVATSALLPANPSLLPDVASAID